MTEGLFLILFFSPIILIIINFALGMFLRLFVKNKTFIKKDYSYKRS
jgi:hypothetical protein